MRLLRATFAWLLAFPVASASAGGLPPASSNFPDHLSRTNRQYDPSIEGDTVAFLDTYQGFHGLESHEQGFWTYLPFGSHVPEGIYGINLVAYPGVAADGTGIYYQLCEVSPTGHVEYNNDLTSLGTWLEYPRPLPFYMYDDMLEQLFPDVPKFDYDGWTDTSTGLAYGVWTERWTGGWEPDPGVYERVVVLESEMTRQGSFLAYYENPIPGLEARRPAIDGNFIAYHVEQGPRERAEIHVGFVSQKAETKVEDGINPSIARVYDFPGIDAVVAYSSSSNGSWEIGIAGIDGSSGQPAVAWVDRVKFDEAECRHVRDPKVGGVRKHPLLVVARGEACGPKQDRNLLLVAEAKSGKVFLVDELPGTHHLDRRPQYDVSSDGRIVYSKWVGPETEDYDIFVLEPDLVP